MGHSATVLSDAMMPARISTLAPDISAPPRTVSALTLHIYAIALGISASAFCISGSAFCISGSPFGISPQGVVDSIVCAAAEAVELPPHARGRSRARRGDETSGAVI
jgi:hypothetical protein